MSVPKNNTGGAAAPLFLVHFTTSLKTGGAETVLCNLVAGLQKVGVHQEVWYTHDGPNRAVIEQLGITTKRVSRLFVWWHLLRRRPKVLHTLLWSANLFGSVAARLLRIPVVCAVHGPSNASGGGKSRVRDWLDKVTARCATKVVAVSQATKDAFTARSGRGDVVVIENGVCPIMHNQSERSELNLAPDDFVVGGVGRLIPLKNFDVLIRAMAQVDGTLVLVGDGPESCSLRRLADELGLNVRFVQGEQALGYYPLFNCFVLPSASEGISMAVLEAMYFGVPVVTTGEEHPVVEHGKTGLLVPAGDARALAKAIEQCKAPLGEAGKKLVQEQFSCDTMVQRYQEVFSKVA